MRPIDMADTVAGLRNGKAASTARSPDLYTLLARLFTASLYPPRAVASRTKQKEEARARRLAEEQARTEQARRQRRLRMLGGVLVGAVAVIAVLIAVSAGGKSGTATPIHPSANGVKLPSPKITNLTAAAKAAGCVITDTPAVVAQSSQNRTHVPAGTKVPYATNPPSYGAHYPSPASDGEYKPGHVPAIGYLVHAMEHGRVEYQYRPGLPTQEVRELESLFSEQDGQWAPGQLLLLFPNPTGMPYAVAATAWGHVLGCSTFNPRIFDALRDFRIAYTDRGPEQLGTGAE